MTQELGLKPGEVRTEQNETHKVTVRAVAGGSFTQVTVRAGHMLVYNHNHRFEFDALLDYAHQKARYL